MPAYRRFRKVPTEVNAIQFTGHNVTDVTNFVGGVNQFYVIDPQDRIADPDIVACVFDKLHSTFVGVKIGDWIIEGIKGEFYPCDHEVFEKTYEPV